MSVDGTGSVFGSSDGASAHGVNQTFNPTSSMGPPVAYHHRMMSNLSVTEKKAKEADSPPQLFVSTIADQRKQNQ